MTKEEQRFAAAVAAMNGLLANNSFIFNMNNDDKPDCDNLLSYAIDCADTLIKELDKHKPSDIDVINAAIKNVEDMGFKPNRFVNIVKIKRLCEDNTHDCPNCNFDDINSIEDWCAKCGSKIEWV